MAGEGHERGELVAGGEDDGAAGDPAVAGVGDDAVGRVLDVGDVDRGGEAGAAGDGGAEKAGGQAAGVGGEAAVGEEGRRPVDGEAAAEGGPVEPGRLEADGAARLGLAGEAGGVEEVAGEIEAVARLLPGRDAEGARSGEERPGGEEGAAPGAGGVGRADALGEEGERRVDLVLDEGGARRGRAEGGAAAVDDEDAVAVAGEELGDERAGYAGADDEDVGELGAVELDPVEGGQAPGHPDRAPGPEVARNRHHQHTSPASILLAVSDRACPRARQRRRSREGPRRRHRGAVTPSPRPDWGRAG